MRLMIDMDDVLVEGGFLYLINEFLGTSYKESDFKDFYMQDIIPNKDEFFEWFKSKNLYDHCTVIPGAIEVVKALNERYDIYIGTAYIYPEIPRESGHILEQKFNCLAELFPFISTEKYVFLSNKSVLDVDIKIDDRIDNLEGAKRKLLFTAYHNEDVSDEELARLGIERVNSWQEVAEKLL